MTIDIVQITGDNAHLLDRVAADVFDHDINSKHVAVYVAEPGHILVVAVNDDRVVGQARAILHMHPDSGCELYVDNLGVVPEMKRTGIATLLMNRLIELGRARGCVDIWLGTEPENEEAKGFYEAFGLHASNMLMFANFVDD